MDSIEDKLELLKTDLAAIIKEAKSPIVAWSGGKDSNLIVLLLKQLGYSIPCLVFPHFWGEHQKKFIKKLVAEYKLQCFYYRPTEIEYKEGTITAYYTLGDKHIPVLFDVIHDDKICGLDVGKKAKQGAVPYFIWDRVICGTKTCDTHPLINKFDFTQFDNVSLPLWDWTDEEVMQATIKQDFPYDERVYVDGDEKADTGNFVGCMKCFSMDMVFCPKANKMIRGLYGIF